MCRSVKKRESLIVQTQLILIGFSNQRWNVAMEWLNFVNLLLTFLWIRTPPVWPLYHFHNCTFNNTMMVNLVWPGNRSPPSSWHPDVLAWTLPRCPRYPLGRRPVDAKSLLRRGLMPLRWSTLLWLRQSLGKKKPMWFGSGKDQGYLIKFRHKMYLVRIRKRLVMLGFKWDMDMGVVSLILHSCLLFNVILQFR